METSLHIRTHSIGPVVDPDLSDAINHQLEEIYRVQVDANVMDSEPPAAGFSELAAVFMRQER